MATMTAQLTPQEIALEAWWAGLDEDERVAIFHKTQIRMAWNASWKAATEAAQDARAEAQAEAERVKAIVEAAQKFAELEHIITIQEFPAISILRTHKDAAKKLVELGDVALTPPAAQEGTK